MPRIRLAVFDMAGTTVDDRVDDVPLVLKSYDDAFRSQGIEVPMETLNRNRGRDKLTVIRELGGEKAPKIYETFLRTLMDNVRKVREVEGASDIFKFLHSRGVKVSTSTGFPAEVADGIIEHLGWLREGLLDHWTCSEAVGASRPNPAMILDAMDRLNILDPKEVLKVDDTAKGIEEGLNAGAMTVGVLTGTQSEETLKAQGPDAVLGSIRELQMFLEDGGLL